MKYLYDLPLKLTDITDNPPIPMFQSNPRKPQASSEEFSIDPREIDKVLSEMAGMVGRWHLFKKFLSEESKVPNDFITTLIYLIFSIRMMPSTLSHLCSMALSVFLPQLSPTLLSKQHLRPYSKT
jgi:hypothetical protein